MVTDPLSDLINQIKTAGAVGKKSVSVPFSALKHSVAEMLKNKGYVENVSEKGEGVEKRLVVELLYTEAGAPRINAVSRFSKPSRRMYMKAGEIKPVKYGRGMLVISTSQGILSDEEARNNGVGGEVLFSIW